jgi:putative SOS response-associated peptidase YedK
MCGRYRRTTSEEELARLYHIPNPKQADLPISHNIAPSQRVLTIRFNSQTQQRSIDALQWGLIPYWGRPNSRVTSRHFAIGGTSPNLYLHENLNTGR